MDEVTGPRKAATGRVTAFPCQKKGKSLQGRSLLGHGRLLVSRVVLMDDALAHGLVELGRRNLERVSSSRGVTGVGRRLELTDPGAELALDCLVACGGQCVRLDALELGLDVCHEESFSHSGRSMMLCHEGDRSDSGPGVGIPVVEPLWMELHAHTTWARTRRSNLAAKSTPTKPQPPRPLEDAGVSEGSGRCRSSGPHARRHRRGRVHRP